MQLRFPKIVGKVKVQFFFSLKLPGQEGVGRDTGNQIFLLVRPYLHLTHFREAATELL